MMTLARFYWRTAQLALLRRLVRPEEIECDYDRISRTYDQSFAKYVGSHSRQMVDRLGLPAGAHVADLACGTGTITARVAERVGTTGCVTSIDRSAGMLAVARGKLAGAQYANVRFVQGDMLAGLASLPDAGLDAVTCGWAIGYVQPVALFRLCRRKLKPGGRVGIVENVRDTLRPVRRTCTKVAGTYPADMRAIMDLHFHLPRDAAHLGRMFARAGLATRELWSGGVDFEFADGAAVLKWVLSTGAGAGFNRMMAHDASQRCDELFVRTIERDYRVDGVIRVAHRYAAGIAQKEA
jgi:ubiquinone/menaquinone biosynthesis C-methylase UbiE